MVGLVVYVTIVPWQTGLAEADMATLTCKIGFTPIMIELEVAGLPVVQVADEVKAHDTTSAFAGV